MAVRVFIIYKKIAQSAEIYKRIRINIHIAIYKNYNISSNQRNRDENQGRRHFVCSGQRFCISRCSGGCSENQRNFICSRRRVCIQIQSTHIEL